MKVGLSTLARNDLRGIAAKVNDSNGPGVAARITLKIVDAMRRLRTFPELGNPGRIDGTRELVVGSLPFIVVYQLRPEHVAILRVIHGAMLWPPAAATPSG